MPTLASAATTSGAAPTSANCSPVKKVEELPGPMRTTGISGAGGAGAGFGGAAARPPLRSGLPPPSPGRRRCCWRCCRPSRRGPGRPPSSLPGWRGVRAHKFRTHKRRGGGLGVTTHWLLLRSHLLGGRGAAVLAVTQRRPLASLDLLKGLKARKPDCIKSPSCMLYGALLHEYWAAPE